MKRLFALTTAILLLLTATVSCALNNGDGENSSGTPGGTAFSLPELPDIGSYQPKTATCFYDAPLTEFKASADYGTIIPYLMGNNGDVPSCGFMTTDGKIITAPIYSDISQVKNGDRWVYSATLKTYSPDGKDSYVGYGTFRTEVEKVQLILPDGSKFVTLPGADAYSASNHHLKEPLIECRIPQNDGGFIEGYYNCYDFDLNFVCDLKDYLYAVILASENGTVTFINDTWSYDEEVYQLKNGVVTQLEGQEAEVYRNSVGGGFCKTDSALTDSAGNVKLSIGKDSAVRYLESADCCFILDPERQTLVRFENDRVTASYQLERPVTVSDINNVLQFFESAGQTYVVLMEAGDVYSVFDTHLRPVKTIDASDAVFSNLVGAETYEGAYRGLVILRDENVTVYHDMSLAPTVLDFAPDLENSYLSVTGGVLMIRGADGKNRFYNLKNDLFLTLDDAFIQKEWATVCSCSETCFVLSYPNPYKTPRGWEAISPPLYRIYDSKTNEVLYDGVTDFYEVTVDDAQYLCFSRAGTSYVCDDTLRVIAGIPDDFYA